MSVPCLKLSYVISSVIVLTNLCMGAAAAQPAAAPAILSGTMAHIKETRSITLGVRESAKPFSFLDDKKQPVGYAVALCLAAVEDIKKQLKLPELKVNYKVVSGAERIPKLLANEIDMECGSTTNTKARQDKVMFSYTYFVASGKVMMPKGLKPIENIRDLQGLTVALSKGTTSEKLFNQLLTSGEVKMQTTQYPSNGDAFKALREGKVTAFPQDDALLLGLASRDKVQDDMVLSALTLSVEPYGVMMRKGDQQLAASVDSTLARLFFTREVNNLYKKWFNTESLNIPMNPMTRDSIARPNKEAGVAMLMGYSL
jgi:glutamate/aspartate transport system substrate-binding protein